MTHTSICSIMVQSIGTDYDFIESLDDPHREPGIVMLGSGSTFL